MFLQMFYKTQQQRYYKNTKETNREKHNFATQIYNTKTFVNTAI